MKVQNEIGRDQEHIQQIEIRHNIVVVQDFMGDPHGIPKNEQDHKDWAFPDYHLGAYRLHD